MRRPLRSSTPDAHKVLKCPPDHRCPWLTCERHHVGTLLIFTVTRTYKNPTVATTTGSSYRLSYSPNLNVGPARRCRGPRHETTFPGRVACSWQLEQWLHRFPRLEIRRLAKPSLACLVINPRARAKARLLSRVFIQRDLGGKHYRKRAVSETSRPGNVGECRVGDHHLY